MPQALTINQLRKTYENGFHALKGIDLTVQEGDFFALLGPNGAGKSTTIGIITSLIKKTAGHVSIFDTDIDRDFSKAKCDLGLVPQEFNFNQFEKVRDILLNQAGFYGLRRAEVTERVDQLLKQLGLWDKRDMPSRSLSGGMKRRLMIARALVHEPRLLILDEPTAGVDIELRRSMWEFLTQLNEAGTTIILTTHYLEEAESLCRNVAIIDGGEIIQNTSVQALLQQLDKEAFILDLQEPVSQLPVLEGFELEQLADNQLQVLVERGSSLNSLYRELDRVGLQVLSMRNRANRLEEMFVSTLEKSAGVEG